VFVFRLRRPHPAVGHDQIKTQPQYTSLILTYRGFRVLFGLIPEPGLSGGHTR
jgi:hypothetical protein